MIKWLCKPRLSKVIELNLRDAKLAESTIRLRRTAWRELVNRGNKRVDKFTPADALAYQNHLLRTKPSPTTARIYRKIVSPVFSWCVLSGWIKTNPFEVVKTPKGRKRKPRPWSEEELRRLFAACGEFADGEVWVTMILTAITTGMRSSAIQNLCIGDIDFERQIINVRPKKECKTTWFWEPKDKDERAVALTPIVARLLSRRMEVIATGQPYIFLPPARYFFILQQRDIGLMNYRQRLKPFSNFDRKFRKLKKKAGVDARFHDLRATCLTTLSKCLNPRELADYAGHSDIETTLTHYVGTEKDLINRARTKVNALTEALCAPSQARYQTAPRPG